jgi:hypothetical protein
VCKYWLQGFCSRGDTCAYVHNLDANELEEQIEKKLYVSKMDKEQELNTNIQEITPKLDETSQFPSLVEKQRMDPKPVIPVVNFNNFPVAIKPIEKTRKKKKLQKDQLESNENTNQSNAAIAKPNAKSHKSEVKLRLGAASYGKQAPVQAKHWNNLDMASKLKMQQLQDRFPQVQVNQVMSCGDTLDNIFLQDDIIHDTLVAHDMKFDDALSRLTELFGPPKEIDSSNPSQDSQSM